MSPTQFGRYELLRPIAQGGMAEVFLARAVGHSGFQKELVIKRILPEFSRDAQFVKMFVDEARIAAQLQHPNIVQVFDFDQVDGVYFIAMEYVEGVDLRSIMEASSLRGERLDLAECLYLTLEVAKALDYAHRRHLHGKPLHIIHRDVSPHNVLVSFDGTVKLGDFGIAKAAIRVTRTQDGVVKGKVAYMSPEQAKGQPLDARSDLFSLGTMLFELLTMRRLFYADSDREVLRKVMAASVPSPRSYNRKLPNDVERVAMRLLQRLPDRRYGSAAELLADLGPVYHSLVTTSAELGLRDRLRKLFPDRVPDRVSSEPGSWPPSPAWAGGSGTPVLPAADRTEPQTPPPRGSPPPIPSDAAAPPAAASGRRSRVSTESREPVAALAASSPAGPGPRSSARPDPFEAVAALETRISEGPAAKRRRAKAPKAEPAAREVAAPGAEQQPADLYDRATQLLPEDPLDFEKTRPHRRPRTLPWGPYGFVGVALVLAGLVTGVVVTLVNGTGGRPGASPGSQPSAVEAGAHAPADAGIVVMRTDPPGARVRVEGQGVAGTTPLSLSVPLNRSTALSVELEGYQREDIQVTVTSASQPVERLVRLRPAAEGPP